MHEQDHAGAMRIVPPASVDREPRACPPHIDSAFGRRDGVEQLHLRPLVAIPLGVISAMPIDPRLERSADKSA